MDKGPLWVIVHGVAESDTTERLTLEAKEKPVTFMLAFKAVFLIKF